MAKVKEVKEVKKVSAEELKVIQDQQKNYQQIVEQLGLADVRKHALLAQLDSLVPKIEETKKALEGKYGNININVSDGAFSEIKSEE
jgi:hypothetical protein|tara:strand:- start:2123 stop:2383 length:261 start_codon:yes stop_codon:yes gene_type:complete